MGTERVSSRRSNLEPEVLRRLTVIKLFLLGHGWGLKTRYLLMVCYIIVRLNCKIRCLGGESLLREGEK